MRGTPPDEPQPSIVSDPAMRHGAQASFGTLSNSAKKLRLVVSAISIGVTVFTSASFSRVFTTKAGSFDLPR